jgi:hypothetical protein
MPKNLKSSGQTTHRGLKNPPWAENYKITSGLKTIPRAEKYRWGIGILCVFHGVIAKNSPRNILV